LKQQVKDGEKCDPGMCMAVDVFGGKVYRAKSQQKQFKTVETSCEEVATVWCQLLGEYRQRGGEKTRRGYTCP
jgi:hypothetical protein